MKKFSVITLGCPKNQVDSEVFTGILTSHGYEFDLDGESPDIVIINTCGFIQDAIDESFATIEHILELKRSSKVKKVVVTGCLVHRIKDKILEKFKDVDLVVGIDEEPKLHKLIDELDSRKLVRPGLKTLKPSTWIHSSRLPRMLLTPIYAYVKVAEGCNRKCAFCVIPKMRGRYRSREIGDIVNEVEMLTRIGVEEIILIAQDLTLYGYDLYRTPQLDKLVRELNKVEGVKLIRLMYLHPGSVTKKLIDAIKESDKVAKYLHIPIQHASDRVLRLMKRAGGRKSVERAFKLVRDELPDFFIRTEAIVGFPGETREDVDELIDFLYRYRPERIALFPYSDEPEATSYRLPGKVPVDEITDRMAEVMVSAEEIMRGVQESLVGKEVMVIMDSELEGRTEHDAPEIDFSVKFKKPRNGIIKARITGITEEGDLLGD